MLDAAWNSFIAAHVRGGQLILQPRIITKSAYRRLIDRHIEQWLLTRECPSRSHKKHFNLTLPELQELADLLATPFEHDGHTHRYTNIIKAIEDIPRVKALAAKSRLSPVVLHDHVLASIPSLQYGPEDRAAQLCYHTLMGRRALADVLSGRVPWLVRPSKVPMRSSRGPITATSTKATTAMQEGAAAPQQNLLEFFWKPEYMDFVFMLDATSFSDKEGPMHARAPHVYYITQDVWGPTEVARDHSISETTSIMVYCVIHKHLGLVVGPDIMFTGTKFKKSKKSKEQQFREHGIKTW